MDQELRQQASEPESEEEMETPENTLEMGEVKVPFKTLLYKVLTSNPPLSETEPGYLLMFVNFLQEEDDLPVQLENLIPYLRRMGQIWNNNTQKATRLGVLEYLENAKSLTAGSFGTSFDSTTIKTLKPFLEYFRKIGTTPEDLSKFTEKQLTSTSSTTASSATEPVGAVGGVKRKRSALATQEIEVDIDEIEHELAHSPMWKNYISITSRREDGSYTKNQRTAGENTKRGLHFSK